MDKATKEKEIASLKEKFQRSSAVFVTGFRGTSVSSMTDLRSKLRAENIEYKVVKNTLANIAVKGTAYEALPEMVDGPTGIVFTSGEPVMSAKILCDFVSEDSPFLIHGGFIGTVRLDVGRVKALSKLPSRNVLLAKLIGSAQSPVQRFVNVLSAVPRDFVYVLSALQRKKSEGTS